MTPFKDVPKWEKSGYCSKQDEKELKKGDIKILTMNEIQGQIQIHYAYLK